MVGRPHRIEYIDQALERDVGVVEGGEVGSARIGEQFGEARSRLDLCSQDECPDEHAHEVVEGRVSSTGDRRTDSDVLGAAQTREQ